MTETLRNGLLRCGVCGQTYRGVSPHEGSDACFAEAESLRLRAMLWVPVRRSAATYALLAAAGVPHGDYFTQLTRAHQSGDPVVQATLKLGGKVYRGVAKESRLWVPWWVSEAMGWTENGGHRIGLFVHFKKADSERNYPEYRDTKAWDKLRALRRVHRAVQPRVLAKVAQGADAFTSRALLGENPIEVRVAFLKYVEGVCRQTPIRVARARETG